MDPQSRIIHQEIPRTYRTEIPNIVFEMLAAGDISSNALVLYSVYRRIAGEHGECWIGTRGLCQKCDLSHPTIAKLKRILSKPFDKLGGKSLIQITPGDKKKEQPDIVTIIDIWPENYRYFKKSPTCEKNLHDPVKKTTTEERTFKKEQIIIAKPQKPKHEPHKPQKKMPAGGNNNFSVYECLKYRPEFKESHLRIFMRYPEALVKEALRYVDHPTTQITGGEIGKVKLMQKFLKHPEDFKEHMQNLDKPPEIKLKSETLFGRFKKGETYNGWEFLVDEIGVGFIKPDMAQPYSENHEPRNTFSARMLNLIKRVDLEW